MVLYARVLCFMHSRFVENPPINLEAMNPLISEMVPSHRPECWYLLRWSRSTMVLLLWLILRPVAPMLLRRTEGCPTGGMWTRRYFGGAPPEPPPKTPSMALFLFFSSAFAQGGSYLCRSFSMVVP
jgi:hypothetical protein